MAVRAPMKDRAFIQRQVKDTRKVEGRRLTSPGWSAEIRARLTISPAAKQRNDGRPHTEPRPILLLYRRAKDGERITPQPFDKIKVVSRELGTAMWEVDGEPRPMRKKRTIVGWELNIKRLKETA